MPCHHLSRVLEPGGTFLLITLGDPSRRLPLLLDHRLSWRVRLLLLPKISPLSQARDADGRCVTGRVCARCVQCTGLLKGERALALWCVIPPPPLPSPRLALTRTPLSACYVGAPIPFITLQLTHITL